MANFLDNKTIILVNSDKNNSGDLINEYANFNCKIHHATTSHIKYQNKNYFNYFYKDFTSLSQNFSNDLKIKEIDILIFFIKDNNFVKQSKKSIHNTFVYQEQIINLSNSLIQKLKKNNYSKFFFILFPLSFFVNLKKNLHLYEMINSSSIGYTMSIAKTLGKYKILSNSILPGFFSTDLKNTYKKNEINNLKKKIPLNRYSNLDDLSSTILFFSSDYNTYFTGQTINVDGGFNSI